MKTKELIKQLQVADPSGDFECTVEGHDIHFVDSNPGYWDGPYELLVRDETQTSCYNVVGAKLTTKGMKVAVRCLSIEDAIFNDPHMPVTYDCTYVNDGGREASFLAEVETWRQEAHAIKNSVERDHFKEYMMERGVDEKIAEAFFNANMTHEDPMPKDIKDLGWPKDGKAGLSWNNRRELQWNQEIDVSGGLPLRKSNFFA